MHKMCVNLGIVLGGNQCIDNEQTHVLDNNKGMVI